MCEWAAIFLVTVFAACAWGQVLIRVEGETLSGRRIVLPDDAHGKNVFLVIGFSRKGGDASRGWEQRLNKDFGADSRYVIYPIAVLEDAPRFMRGIIKSGIRRGAPPSELDRFVIMVHGEDELKRFVAYSAQDDAYLILVDRNGETCWRGHGSFEEQQYRALREMAMKVAAK